MEKLWNYMVKIVGYLQVQRQRQKKTAAVLDYLFVMMFICASVVVFLITSVVPKCIVRSDTQAQILPLSVQILVSLSEYFVKWWPLLFVGIIVLLVAFRIVTAKMLTKFPETYDEKIEIAIEKITPILEFLVIVGICIVVGFIVMTIHKMVHG